MLRNPLSHIALAALLAGCGSSGDRQPAADTTTAQTAVRAAASNAAAAGRAMAFKKEMDSLVKFQRIFVQTFVRVKDSEALVEVYSDGDWPEEANIVSIYNLSYRPNGSTQFFSEKPRNLQGRRAEFTHYFDENNRAVAFEKYVIHEVNKCTGGTAIETDVTYYDSTFAALEHIFSLTDDSERPIEGPDCLPGGLQDFTVYSSYTELAKAKGTKLMELQLSVGAVSCGARLSARQVGSGS